MPGRGAPQIVVDRVQEGGAGRRVELRRGDAGAEHADALAQVARQRDGRGSAGVLRDAQLRRTPAGETLGADEALTAEQALALHTRGAAVAMGVESRVGSLEVGKLADFAVLDRNPLAVSPEAVGETVVRRTVVGGEVVFDRLEVPAHA